MTEKTVTIVEVANLGILAERISDEALNRWIAQASLGRYNLHHVIRETVIDMLARDLVEIEAA
jgi:hypothetical protein